jgi:hypothetical protein
MVLVRQSSLNAATPAFIYRICVVRLSWFLATNPPLAMPIPPNAMYSAEYSWVGGSAYANEPASMRPIPTSKSSLVMEGSSKPVCR